MEENNNFQKIKRKKETSRYIFKDKKFKIFLKTGWIPSVKKEYSIKNIRKKRLPS